MARLLLALALFAPLAGAQETTTTPAAKRTGSDLINDELAKAWTGAGSWSHAGPVNLCAIPNESSAI